MAGSIPPLVSSSPPPLAFDDDDDEEEEEEDEFGMYDAAEDIDYSECIPYKEKEKDNRDKSRGEQDSTSQDSATDSGLCPDSEGMSTTPHSDDEKTVKQTTCDHLFKKSADPPTLKNQCNSEYSSPLESSTVNLKTPNGHIDPPPLGPVDDDDFGNFENFEFSAQSIPKEQGIVAKEVSDCSVISLEPKESGSSDVLKTEEYLDSEQSDCVLKPSNGNSHSNESLNDESSETNDSLNDIHSESPASNLKELTNEQSQNFHPEFSESKEYDSDEHKTSLESNEFDKTAVDNTVIAPSEQSSEMNENFTEFDDDDEFDDFTDFKANFSNSLDLPEVEQSYPYSEHSKEEQGQSDDALKTIQTSQQDESDDEFSNFADFSSSDCAFASAQSSNSLESAPHIPMKTSDDNDLRTDSEFQDWVSVFPSEGPDSSTPGSGSELVRADDMLWTRLFPLDSTPALSYQWAESLSNRQLLSSLNIDSRNILFMPWSSGVPRFVANLSRGPLEPVKAKEPLQPILEPSPAPVASTSTSDPPLLPTPTSSGNSSSSSQEVVLPDAHFDWVSSGLTNPLDSSHSHSSLLDLDFMMTLATHLTISPKPVLKLPKIISAEAESILSSLPDLSFMRKTYIDFPISKG